MRTDSTKYQRILILILMLIFGCCSKPGEYAPERNFYFTVETNSTSETAVMIKHYLETSIPAFNYSFTNSSAQHWPYYRAFEPGEKIPIDSLMPPHMFIHKMVPSEKHHQPEEDEFLVQIEIFAEPDTLPNYSVTILRWKNREFQLSASTGLHYIQPSEYRTREQLADILLKNIVRYSFK